MSRCGVLTVIKSEISLTCFSSVSNGRCSRPGAGFRHTFSLHPAKVVKMQLNFKTPRPRVNVHIKKTKQGPWIYSIKYCSNNCWHSTWLTSVIFSCSLLKADSIHSNAKANNAELQSGFNGRKWFIFINVSGGSLQKSLRKTFSSCSWSDSCNVTVQNKLNWSC